MKDMGIVRVGHHLLWGMHCGHLLWLPSWVRHLIVTLWNHMACTFMGHSTLTQEEQNGPVICTSCTRRVRRFDSKKVLPVWQDWEAEA